ncbi:MAG: DUF4268 domain-containing protein [Firmicutes bacterium]|jgi:hypothetical protein|nr:DUF4268 domain-containing protein [Bacillota bacterium]
MNSEHGWRIEGSARCARELLDNARYTIDYYQREYAWQERQTRELVEDLTSKFLDFYEPSHERSRVEQYGHYFLGSIVISNKRGRRYIVDGQQRLTTLTLLLIHLHHLQSQQPEGAQGRDLRSLIYSEKFGTKSFNLDIEERVPVMHALLNGERVDVDDQPESVQNIVARYNNIADHFPEEIAGHALPYFIDWLIENVHFVEIEAYSDEDAYTIFETMNDRGLSLSLPDMLKGYVLASIHGEQNQRAANAIWQSAMQRLKQLGPSEDVDFFKDWLRARHAQTSRDYERIGSEFHRWIRDRKDLLGLSSSESFIRFVQRDVDFYARQFAAVRRAAREMTPGWESIRYNEDRGFTLQTQLILAPLSPDDSPEDVRKKIALVADFIDIWLARRVWNFRSIAHSSVRRIIFAWTRDIRDLSVAELSMYLRRQLDEQLERFARQPRLRLHQQNYRQIRHILARITHWLDVQCGLASHFDDLVSEGRARPFEIEHIWADRYDRFADLYPHPSDFDEARNRIGGLLLLQRGLNQSLSDAPYEQKRNAYVSHGQNLLARSLHPLAYENNPAFLKLIDVTGLPFRPYERFGPDEQAERQELYIRMAEWVWNPSRLDLDGEKPPVPEPINDPEEISADGADKPMRGEARLRFWTELLEHAKTHSGLHANISPNRFNWIGSRRHGQWWNYNVLQDETRVELYIDSPVAEDNKALFDALLARKEEIETDFGESLTWQRLDDKRACRISFTVPGGWADESTWPNAIDSAVEAMNRLYRALAPRVKAIRGE